MEESITGNEVKNAYENQMIEAFVNNPEKTAWYQEAFKKYQINGVDKIAWNWNWWAFLGGPFYLLYRKTYLAGLVLLLFTIAGGVIIPPSPFRLIVPILAGGLSTYFVYKEYKKKKAEIERTVAYTQKRLDTMRVVGGYNRWAIWVPATIVSVYMIWVITYLVPKKANETFGHTHTYNIKYSDYKQIQTGMTYQEVVSIIGEEDAEISNFTLYDIENITYGWKNGDGGNIILTFQNDKLASKAQVGLNRR